MLHSSSRCTRHYIYFYDSARHFFSLFSPTRSLGWKLSFSAYLCHFRLFTPLHLCLMCGSRSRFQNIYENLITKLIRFSRPSVGPDFLSAVPLRITHFMQLDIYRLLFMQPWLQEVRSRLLCNCSCIGLIGQTGWGIFHLDLYSLVELY